MNQPHRRRREAGFTLIELVISAAITAIILGASYACLRAGLATRKMVESRSDTLQGGRVALAMMSADLRSATPLSSEFEFLGMTRTLDGVEMANLDFATHNYTARRERESDYCEVSYFVDRNAETGRFSLWRRRDPTPDPEPLKGGQREELVQGVRSLTIDYYDGFEWFTFWGDATGEAAGRSAELLESNLEGMPDAVRIRLVIDAGSEARRRSSAPPSDQENKTGEPPLVLETIVRLNLASLANSSVGGDTASAQSGASTPPAN